MTSCTATEARQNFFDMVKKASKGHRIFRIQHRIGNAVLMSEEDYDVLVETLDLLSIPDFRESLERSVKDVERGDTYRMDEILGDEK